MSERVWSEKDLVRRANRRLAVLQHAEEVSGMRLGQWLPNPKGRLLAAPGPGAPYRKMLSVPDELPDQLVALAGGGREDDVHG